MWEPATKTFHLRNTPNAGWPDTKPVDDDAGTVPLTGDWNGDGIDTIGLYEPATRTFRLRDSNTAAANHVLTFGSGGDIPVVGDWNGDGSDTIGVWRPSTHYFYLNNEHTNNVADGVPFVYGATGMTPLAGDWNGDGYDTIGMYDSTNIMVYLRNSNSAGGNHHEIRYGSPGDKPVVGDWNQNKVDTVGVWRPGTHYFYLNNENTNNGADLSFVYGAAGMLPLSGIWSTETGIPSETTISWQARAYDGENWDPWSSANAAGRCVVKRDGLTPTAPRVSGEPYKDDEVWRSGVGKPGTFTLKAGDDDVVGYRYTFDDQPSGTVATTGGAARSIAWTPMWAGRHTLSVVTFDAANRTSAEADYQFKVVDDGPVGQWNLGDLEGSTEAHEEMGRLSAIAGPGVTFGVAGPGREPAGAQVPDGAAYLDGTADAFLTVHDAESDADPSKRASVVDTTQSFSVSAWVNPAVKDRDMTVLSQDGTDGAGFFLGYDATAGGWVFDAPGTDGTATTRWRVKADAAVVTNHWVHLTGIFDAHAPAGERLSLRVDDGQPVTAPRSTTMPAGEDFQIGRSLADGAYGRNFEGKLAEVRAYTRVVTAEEVAKFQKVKPDRKAYWQFETLENGAVPNLQSGGQALNPNGPVLYQMSDDPLADPPSVPALSGNGHMEFDGVDDWAGAAQGVVTAEGSYTVSARVRLTSSGATQSQTLLSLPGQNAERLVVRYDAPTQRWQVVVRASDTVGAPVTVLTHSGQPPAVDGAGDHIAVVHDAVTRQVRLYVNGQSLPEEVRLDKTPWPIPGGLELGRSTKSGAAEHIAGAVDEVRVYAGALDQTGIVQIRNLNPNPNI
jgi:hypothetical protein